MANTPDKTLDEISRGNLRKVAEVVRAVMLEDLREERDALVVENARLREELASRPWVTPCVQPNWEWLPPTWMYTGTAADPLPEGNTVWVQG